MRTSDIFLAKALHWADQFDICCFLDSHLYPDPYSNFDAVIAAGANDQLTVNAGNAFEQLKHFYQQHRTWIFGWLGYDLKNETEDLQSVNEDKLGFEDLFFFVPRYVIGIKNNDVQVLLGDENILDEINKFELPLPSEKPSLNIKQKLAKQDYLERVSAVKNHILRGDIYEANFCQEFYCTDVNIQPISIFQELSKLSPTPFSGYFKRKQHYILSATPERFLRKQGNQLISQPIKGTAKRGTSKEEDLVLKINLQRNQKERSENIMIVDLVRNDLTKCAKKGTVKVDELCEVYTFPQVHQMISTVSCQLDEKLDFIEAIKNCFPMGSMTGAPKVNALKLIEKYEASKRGVYAGSFGYIDPQGDFDFNVIIRSILYNQENNYLSFQVGSAITHDADPLAEYEECMLKASAIKAVLTTT